MPHASCAGIIFIISFYQFSNQHIPARTILNHTIKIKEILIFYHRYRFSGSTYQWSNSLNSNFAPEFVLRNCSQFPKMPLLTEREQLARLVEQWNENRLELFHLSYPTEDLEIEGVMRFYFQVWKKFAIKALSYQKWVILIEKVLDYHKLLNLG